MGFFFRGQAGTCLTSSTSGVAVSAETSGEAVRGESEPALILAIFLFPAQKWQKKNSNPIIIRSNNFGS